MDRRTFFGSCAAVASLAVVGQNPKPKWQAIVGGLRSGKSTIAANIAKQHKNIIVFGCDMYCTIGLAREFGIEDYWAPFRWGDRYFMKLENKRCFMSEPDLPSTFLWIDEAAHRKPEDIEFITNVARNCQGAVWSNWPTPAFAKTEFYRECEAMGTVTHTQPRAGGIIRGR